MDGAVPVLTVTDPPYGVNYDPDWRWDAGLNHHTGRGRHGVVENDEQSDWREAWALSPSEVFYVWHSGVHSAAVADSLSAAGIVIRSQIIWAKRHLPISRGHYHWQHEPCWYAVRKGMTGHWIGDRKQSTLWEIQTLNGFVGGKGADETAGETGVTHGTQKPVECMERPIRNHDAPEVYDPFLGSGTTLIACERLGRRCYAMEIAEQYVDVAVRRWEQFTGREAVLANA